MTTRPNPNPNPNPYPSPNSNPNPNPNPNPDQVFDDEGSDSARKLTTTLSKGTYVASTSGQAEPLSLTLTLALPFTLPLAPPLALPLARLSNISRISPRQAERNAEMAHHMMALFEANRFRGHLEGPVRSHRLPLLQP